MEGDIGIAEKSKLPKNVEWPEEFTKEEKKWRNEIKLAERGEITDGLKLLRLDGPGPSELEWAMKPWAVSVCDKVFDVRDIRCKSKSKSKCKSKS